MTGQAALVVGFLIGLPSIVDAASAPRPAPATSAGLTATALTSNCEIPPSPPLSEVVFTPPYGSNPWPLSVITDKTSSEVKAIAHGEHGAVSGFLRPVVDKRGGAYLSPIVTVEWAFSDTSSNGVRCAYVSTVHIQHSALEMYIASEYAADSCAFAQTYRHEMLHYADMSAMLRMSQQRIRTALRQIRFPIARVPWHRKANEPIDPSMADAKTRSAVMVQHSVQPIADDIDKEAVRRGSRRDEPARLDAVFRRCPAWFGISDTRLARAPAN
jgi:hypothetical protein